MKADQQTELSANDSSFITIPPDRFLKTCHDTTPEGITINYREKPDVRSFYTGHQLHADKIKLQPTNKYQPDWILFLLILCFILQAWVQFIYRKRFRQLVLAPFSKRFLNQLVRDGNLFNERLSLALGIIYFVSSSLLIYEVNDLLLGGLIPAPLNKIAFYLLIVFTLVLFWIIKVTGIRLLGKVFKTEYTAAMYLLNVFIINFITGLILLPLLVIVIYLKSVLILYISLILIILSLFFLFVRGFLTGLLLTKFSYIFLFVYLCTLEILPLIILIKFSLIFYNSMITVN
jgi:hypothetical protein